MSDFKDYTNISGIKKDWIEKIAPNYLDLENVNNYQSGIFGYINEVMAEGIEDGFAATNRARKEFYPVTAEYESSLHKMAAMQKVSAPTCTPARCKAALIIPQKDIIENSTVNNGLYECTIDSCLKIYADNLQFMLDYPIKILSYKNDDGGFIHVVHYDIGVKNSLANKNDNTYISNKLIIEDNTVYTVLFLDTIRQVECETFIEIIQPDPTMNNAIFEIEFEGNLANFEVYYKESSSTNKIQLEKVMEYGAYPPSPFVCYRMMTANKIRFSFPENNVFMPGYNSEAIINIYTSEGTAGNFESYNGDLVCSSDSEDYPYNANMIILGKVNGSSFGGLDMISKDQFRNEVMNAYATNKTIAVTHDLQLFFNDKSKKIPNINLLFRKKRDDVYLRLYGAYVLLKDNLNNTIPSNTLNLDFLKSDIMDVNDSISKIIIKPGQIFKYKSDTSFDIEYEKVKKLLEIKDNNEPYFTNPFLIAININPNLVGYYLNSINTTKSIQYTYVNDKSSTQFISSSLSVKRNAMNGGNYYELSINLLPATADFDFTTVCKVNDSSDVNNIIIAEQNGKVIAKTCQYDTTKKYGYVEVVYEYDDNSTHKIQASSAIKEDGTRLTGYDVKYDIGDKFIVGDILATKLDDDLGQLTIVGDFENQLFENNMYIPFVIEKFLPEGGLLFKAYLSTDDKFDSSNNIPILHGIYNKDGTENENVAVPMRDIVFNLSTLYNIIGNNMPHRYTEYTNLSKFTLTNTYETDPNDKIHFITPYTFTRSVVDYVPTSKPNDLSMHITEIPVLQAWWCADENNYKYFINKISSINDILLDAYQSLENGYSIDMKFYNTFGKSRFYTVGDQYSTKRLDQVKCKLKFGINILPTVNANNFIEKFRTEVKSYIENTDNITTAGQNIYIMNLISHLKETFNELVYLEYYGLNVFGKEAQKIIGPKLDEFHKDFIPEFINIGIIYDANNAIIPDIEVIIVE